VFKRLRKWVASERSWPALLLIIAVAYWLSPREWWGTVTFFCLGMLYLGLVTAHLLEFWRIQRKTSYLIFAIAKFWVGVALIVGALVTVPQTHYDFTSLGMVSRVLWLIGLPFWAVAVYSECWRIYRLLKEW
jgi:hypothetical protein